MKILIIWTLFGISYGAPQSGSQQDRRQNPAPFQRDQSAIPPRQPVLRPNTNTYTRTEEPVRILRFENINNGDGSYNFGYETENGINVGEEGVLRVRGADLDPITAVKGFFQYFAPEGHKLRVDYTADENGFVPHGDHLPTPPPIPEAIMRSLAIIYANAEKQKQLEQNGQNRNRF